mmetsp:Transcript_1949/g.4762  ORF Transcript_1949/g.4762 Transcript_1949/m.4762 type:complete len:89 (-) Transcript_1949:515-781(-)
MKLDPTKGLQAAAAAKVNARATRTGAKTSLYLGGKRPATVAPTMDAANKKRRSPFSGDTKVVGNPRIHSSVQSTRHALLNSHLGAAKW